MRYNRGQPYGCPFFICVCDGLQSVECNFIELEILVRTDDRARLALGLPMMGAAYSKACRDIVCILRDQDCTTCSGRGECPWHLVFGQELTCDPAALRRHQKPPLPFVFSFPFCDHLPETPGTLACGLVVVGSGISCLGMLLDGFTSLLADRDCPAQGRVVQVFTRDYQGMRMELVTGDRSGVSANLIVKSSTGLLDCLDWSGERCRLELLTPLKLRVDGRQARRFEFSHFARSLLRRVSSLIYYYERIKSGLDFKDLSRQVDAIVCNEGRFRFEDGSGSTRQIAGILGQGVFSGDLGGLMPFLVLGSYFHVGKSSSFGFGRYSLCVD